MTFEGFPARGQATAIPNVFFTDVLPPLADDPAAVGVALYAFGVLMRKRGFPRYLTSEELAAEPALIAYLRRADAPGDLERGLRRCTEAGILLELQQVIDGRETALYFLNAPADRRAMEAVRADGIASGRVVPFRPAAAEKKGVFALYEQEIGTLTPQVIEQLTEVEQLYPAGWIERAFREAAAQNARSWRYVERILERWAAEGPDRESREPEPRGDERYFRGRYGRVLRERDGT